jgi:carboxyl-terminal processing protease
MRHVALSAGLFLLLQVSVGAPADSTLHPKATYGKEASVMAYLLENSHYRKTRFSDSLSAVIFDRYVSSLDNSRAYFLASDIRSLEKYRLTLDDVTRDENVDAAYEIYGVFRERFLTRMNSVISDLTQREYTYTSEEWLETDRENAPWAASMAELDDYWVKSIKHQALSLKLAGKPAEEIKSTLKTRFERLRKGILQYNTEDIFSLYMNAISESFDPHTNYLSPKAYDLFKQDMSLSLEGIGAQLQTENDYTRIAGIVPGGPADKSGKLHVNDKIIGVAQGDDRMVDVIGWRVDEVVKLIKGPKGTKVRLLILPGTSGLNGPTEELSLIRDKVKLEDRAAKKKVVTFTQNGKPMKMGIVSLPSFYMDFDAYQRGDRDYRSTTRDVRKLVEELKTEGIDGLVLDLRNNGGGSLQEAIDLTGLFIRTGPVVQVRNGGNQVQVGSDDDPAVLYNGPLVVLTNRFSASASEIFAGAIQDYRRGIVVGDNTYGKGTVQRVIELSRFIPKASEPVGDLKITFQKFYRVTGSSTQHKGVKPDIELPSAWDARYYGESASPSALPWDVIRPTSFTKYPDVSDKLLSSVTRSSQERMKSDPEMKRLAREVEEFRKSQSETRVSLNEATRRKEMEEAEKRKAASDALSAKVSKEGLPETDILRLDDEVLREGLLVLGEVALSRIG